MSIPLKSLRQSTEPAETAIWSCPAPTRLSPNSLRWLALAILLFLFQALPFLSYRWVTDESWYAAPAYSIASGDGIKDPAIGPNDLENHFDARPPGTALTIAAAFKLFGVGQTTARLGSILAGVAIVLFTFFLARDFLGEQGALVAAFLVATDNLLVLTSRTARPEALTTMMILASMLAIKRYAASSQLLWAGMSGLLIAMGTMFHITLLGFIVSFGLLAIAIDWKRGKFVVRGAIAYSLGYVFGLVPFAAWILTSPLGNAGFHEEYLSRAGGKSMWMKFLREGHRYSDLLGLNMLHGHHLESIPLRLPIPLLFLAASYLLWKHRRQWFYLELVLLSPSVFWLIYTVNKSSRYLAILAPIFALAIGGAVAASATNRKLHSVVLVLSCAAVAAQMAANLYLLRGARTANYNKVAAELQSVIPTGQTAYGTITFWLALHDHPYISYERTDPWVAAKQYHARYFIAGDRMMTTGQPGDEDFFQGLNQTMAEVIAQSKLIAEFPDPYYGDLKVYQLQAQ